jgi:peptidoglycan/LPS O-acetylase OafA/YrhL
MAALPQFEWVFGHPFPPISYATFTQNILMGMRGDFGPHWLGVTWSLAVEEQFYLFMPLLIYLLPRRALFCVLSVGALTAPVLRCISPGFHAYVNTPWHADTLLSGACLAVLVRSHSFVATVKRYKGILLGLFLVLLAVVAFQSTRPPPLGALAQCWLAGLYVSFVLIAFIDKQPLIGRVLRLPALVWFGQRSYALYMFHESISGLCHGWLSRAAPRLQAPADAAITVLALLLTLVLAELSFRRFENPILEFGHKARYRPKGQKEPALHSVAEGA